MVSVFECFSTKQYKNEIQYYVYFHKMVRASKQSTPSTSVPTASAPTTSVPSKETPVKKAAPSAPKKVVAPATKTAEVVASVPAPAVDGPVSEEVVADDLVELLTSFSNKINQGTAFFTALKAQFKVLQKSVLKAHKTAQKVSNRKNKRSGNRKPSGFVRPTLISDELAEFLGKPSGTELARTEVSKEINNYIRTNKLQDEKNGRQINADPKLSTLLRLPAGDSLTYFNLQRYMKHHFVKVEAPVVAAVAV
jgi:chromatin remodeling complex protein RSC6